MGLFDSQQDAAPSGLFGQGFNDPRSAAILALAGSMVRGDFGGGLMGANKAFQDTQDSVLKRADVSQQIGLRNIQLQQAVQQWKMMQPILQQVSSELSGGGAVPGAAAQPAQPAIGPTTGGGLGSGTFGIPTGGQPAASTPTPQGSAFSGGGGGSVMGLPRSVALTSLAFGGPGKFADAVTQYNSPTDLMKTLISQGVQPGTPQWNQAMQGNIAKTNYIAPVNARPGSIIRDPLNPQNVLAFNPHVPEGSTPQFDQNGNVVAYQPLGNAEQALALPERARKTGSNQVTPSIVYGPDGTPKFSTVAQDVNRAAGLPATAPNFGAQASQPTTAQPTAAQPADADRSLIYTNEMAAAQARLASAKSPTEVQRALDDVAGLKREMARIGISPTPAPQQPATQQAVQPVSDVMPTLKPGTAPAQIAPSEQMKSDYATMASAGPQAQQSLEYLDHLIELANKKPFYMGVGIGGLPGVDRVSTDAAEYEKARASYISAQGKALGSAGTDAARSTIEQAVPEYGKPQDAMIRGLTDQRNQLVTGMLRRQVLAPVYQAGNEKAYTELSNGFDQNIKPSMVPVLSLPSSAKRAAIKAAIEKDPSLRPSYEWAFNHGLAQ
jgi:hypothetical protein